MKHLVFSASNCLVKRQFDTEPLNAVEQIWHCQEPWLQLKPPAGDAAGPRHLCWLSDPLPNGNLNAGYSVQSTEKQAAQCSPSLCSWDWFSCKSSRQTSGQDLQFAANFACVWMAKKIVVGVLVPPQSCWILQLHLLKSKLNRDKLFLFLWPHRILGMANPRNLTGAGS